MTAAEIFIDAKRVKLAGKTLAQLEHLLQLAKDQRRRYDLTTKNYPADRMERLGKPFYARIDGNIAAIEAAIKAL
jgi:hypothetical protein